jgi:ArsR family transcriptional regulator, arsenate/arsenite/antimonite-responsive transcriptional repressor
MTVNIDNHLYWSHMNPTDQSDIRLLQAIADPTRLAILRQLASNDEVCACDFTDCCNVSQPTISHHLRVLRQAGWVESERRGSWVWYRLRPEATARLRAIAGELSASAADTDSRSSAPTATFSSYRCPARVKR